MIKIENTEVVGWEHAIRGMRNPKNSWDRSDSERKYESWHDMSGGTYEIGPNDHKLMMQLAAGGPVHAKYRRMIVVYVDITAPLYWWKEFDTYKVGTVANSCSTMHKIHAKKFTRDDFSWDHLTGDNGVPDHDYQSSTYVLDLVIESLNFWREEYLTGKETGIAKDKRAWWQMIQLLPSSYNQKRTVMLNYEVLAGIYPMRKNHKLDEWRLHDTPVEHSERNKDFSSGMWGFCDWIESLPYSEIIIGEKENNNE